MPPPARGNPFPLKRWNSTKIHAVIISEYRELTIHHRKKVESVSALLFHMQQDLNFYILTHTDFRLRRVAVLYLVTQLANE